MLACLVKQTTAFPSVVSCFEGMSAERPIYHVSVSNWNKGVVRIKSAEKIIPNLVSRIDLMDYILPLNSLFRHSQLLTKCNNF